VREIQIEKPRENPGLAFVRGLSREGHATSAAREGSLADGGKPFTVAGPRPIYTALPHSPSLQIEITVYGSLPGVSTGDIFTDCNLSVFPVRLALFN
jgi:hypothetical protein